MIHLSDSLGHYKRPEIQQAIAEHAANKEIAARFNERFGKRPDALQYPNDVLTIAKKGATSFHASEELWRNPLGLQPGMTRKQLDEMRIGWDLVLDVDCKFIEYSKLAAQLILQALGYHGIRSISIKYSGNNGFHVGVPYEAFPAEIDGKPTSLLFPEAAKRAALYIKEKIKPFLGKQILQLEKNSFNEIAKKTGVNVKNLHFTDEKGSTILNPEPFLEIDTLLISSRHLYRMPYSLHEKSGLVSIPLNPEEITSFEKKMARPEIVSVTGIKFLDREKSRSNEATKFFTDAFDATVTKQRYEPSEEKKYEISPEAIPEAFFPECIKKLLQGVEEGRKRSLFVLINFLSSCNWSYEDIETRLRDWNKKNKEPLHETYFLGQVRYAKQHKKRILPPNCSNSAYYSELRVKCPEEVCSKIKNPVVFARRRTRFSEPKKKPRKGTSQDNAAKQSAK